SPVDDMYGQLDPLRKDRPLKDMIPELAQLPLVTHPGIAWRYSVSTDVLGYLVEVISGTPLRTFFKERIFDPLGMTDTDFYAPENKHHRFATNYGLSKNGIQVIDDPTTGEFSQPPQFHSGGGGLISTASDYLQFTHLLLNNGAWQDTQLLSKKTVEIMTTNHLLPHHLPLQLGASQISGHGFGLGVAVLTDVAQSENLGSVGEYRWGGAATTAFWIDPKEELIGLLLTQFMPASHYPIRSEFKTLVSQAIIS
ncbi:MAG: beta-lactamase family protein, partial [Candidatus Latescibacteria bacterium]|nr:beta-lactamase family protein [Candidatus Latescibacterota bacterium]